VLSDAEAANIADESDTSKPFYIERLVWLALYEKAHVSVANNTILVFS
jgi:hypothetical protein